MERIDVKVVVYDRDKELVSRDFTIGSMSEFGQTHDEMIANGFELESANTYTYNDEMQSEVRTYVKGQQRHVFNFFSEIAPKE